VTDAPAPSDEDPPVDIHKPKPWHGFRGFFKEYLIIVVGVLTALAGEQGVEWLHHQGEVAETRKVLHSEIALNAGLSRVTMELERCRAARLDQYVAWAHGGVHPPQILGVTQPQLRTSNWETVKTSAVTHMPLEERLAYGYFYNAVEIANGNMDAESALWPKLQAIGAKERPSQTEADEIGGTAAQLRGLIITRSTSAEHLIEQARTLGVAPGPVPDRFLESARKSCAAAGLTSRL
jgi:hypothetical protein